MTGTAFFADCWWALVLTAILSYLLGSCSFAILVTRWFSHTDIRDYGSGNAGATNVLRSQGIGPAVLTTVGDLAKSILSVLIGYWLVHGALALVGNGEERLPYELIGKFLAGLCCIFGHLYPIFFGFRGGKGVMASFGMLLILDWRAALCCLAVFILVVVLSRMVSLGSVIAVCCSPFITVAFAYFADGQHSVAILCFCGCMMALVALILTWKHLPNLHRIAIGTENKISFKRKEA